MKNNESHSAATDEATIPQHIIEELIAWTVKLNSGLVQEQERLAFNHWRALNPLHEKAWQKLQSVDLNFQAISTEEAALVSTALDVAHRKRKQKSARGKQIKLLGFSGLVIVASTLFITEYAPGLHQQSYAAAIGKKQIVQLVDGTKLSLNTNSKVDVSYSFFKREIVLLQGEIYVETGHDATSFIGRRAFWVKTKHADLQAIGTRFAVRQAPDATMLHVSEGVVGMHAGDHQPVYAYVNDTYAMRGETQSPAKVDAVTLDPMGWIDNVLIAKQMRLEDFVAELSRYRSAPVLCDQSAKNLKVSGVFQLDVSDPVEHTLSAVVRTLPVKLTIQADHSTLVSHQ